MLRDAGVLVANGHALPRRAAHRILLGGLRLELHLIGFDLLLARRLRRLIVAGQRLRLTLANQGLTVALRLDLAVHFGAVLGRLAFDAQVVQPLGLGLRPLGLRLGMRPLVHLRLEGGRVFVLRATHVAGVHVLVPDGAAARMGRGVLPREHLKALVGRCRAGAKDLKRWRIWRLRPLGSEILRV